MRARYLAGAAALALGAALAIGPAEAAKTCKDAVTAKGTSRIQGGDAARETRARDNATKNWVKKVQATDGILFKYWWRAEEKTFECAGTEKSKRCTVSAKPCRIY